MSYPESALTQAHTDRNRPSNATPAAAPDMDYAPDGIPTFAATANVLAPLAVGLDWLKTPRGWAACEPGTADPTQHPATWVPAPAPADLLAHVVVHHLRAVEPANVLLNRYEFYGAAFVLHGAEDVTAEVVRVPGRHDKNDRNVSRRYRAHQGRYRVQMGYALLHGFWLQHAWLRDAAGRVVETSPERYVRYYGGLLSDDTAELFARLMS